jgi:hypothetical protein
MTFTLLWRKTEVREALAALRRDLSKGAQFLVRDVGWPGGHGRYRIEWQPAHRFWTAVRSDVKNRHWIAFGTQNPADPKKSLNITCEINPPKEGVNRRCAGAFLRGSDGAFYLAHSGRVGGGKKGVGQAQFVQFYQRPPELVDEPEGKVRSALVIGKISNAAFLKNLRSFLSSVERFKDAVVGQDIDDQLERDAGRALREGAFEPDNLKESKEKILREVNLRRGQPVFRKRLLKAYGGRCAISDCDCAEALEAAHILPYSVGGDDANHVQNGLLLRSDLHALFDLGKLKINPSNFAVMVDKSLLKTVYAKLDGVPLRRPNRSSECPNSDALNIRYANLQAT